MISDLPEQIPNLIDGRDQPAAAQEWLDKLSPHTGQVICRAARSKAEDVDRAVEAAAKAQPGWAEVPPVKRGLLLFDIAIRMKEKQEQIARIVALETGKSFKESLGETGGAIEQAFFMAGEGQRLYGRTTTSGTPNKTALTIRQPVGTAGLIVAANTPIANVAWKVFPALICGNGVVLKSAEDTPATAWIFGQIAREAGLPDGALNIVHGYGPEAGAALVANEKVDLISFTGSSRVGREIASVCAGRLAKVSLEMGGKNPMIVCDDADLENAVKWAALSAFSNAGQRCASAGRIIVFESRYEKFREMLLKKTADLLVGPGDDDDLGPVINKRQLDNMTAAVKGAVSRGARVIAGGDRLAGPKHENGFYMAPTIIENVHPDDEISVTELFGPIVCLYKAGGFEEALALADRSPYGLTACIHTASVNRALEFAKRIKTGVAVVNAGTYGSEPHMPFGGLKQSGNGTREPGTEALDVYSELKDVYLMSDPGRV